MNPKPHIDYDLHFTRRKVQNNLETFYVFGDNVMRTGYGGQAKACRGEINAIGIRTKYAPHNGDNAFFGQNIEQEKQMITNDLALVEAALNSGRKVVFPLYGIGTGRADLENRAPEVAQHLKEGLAKLGVAFRKQL